MAFVVLVGGCVLLALNDRAVRIVGTCVQWLRNAVLRKRARLTGFPERLLEQRNEVRGALGSRWWQSLLATVGNRALDYFALLACLAAVGTDPDYSRAHIVDG